MNLHAQLGWLPRLPASLKDEIRTIRPRTWEYELMRRLASHYLNEVESVILGRVLSKNNGHPHDGLDSLHLFILSNGSTSIISPAIAIASLRHRMHVEVQEGLFSQVAQEVANPESALYVGKSDVVLLALDYRWFADQEWVAKTSDPDAALATWVNHLETLVQMISARSNALCVVQTITPPPFARFGSYDRSIVGSLHWLIEGFNRELRARCATLGVLLFDVAALAALVGVSDWHDYRVWNSARLPFATHFAPLYADHFCRLLAASRGRSRKCLVLDLDGTLWGGSIGDDGLDGIKLSAGDGLGEAYREFQRHLLTLRNRGVLLAVCSKNSLDVALTPFLERSDMLLRRDHFASFVANWEDKATNLVRIARELDLGLDALVFVDDSPAERELVRQALPDVAVIELPEDASLFGEIVCASGHFESIHFSEEDARRADMYLARKAEREQREAATFDLFGYLQSLEMEAVVDLVEGRTLPRVVQLINKTNQFNTTNRRYSSSEIAALAADKHALLLQVRLKDKFSDMGLVSVVICTAIDEAALSIDLWVMSCRVLGRKLEYLVLDKLKGLALKKGFTKICGTYISSTRNGLVEGLFQELGFRSVPSITAGGAAWECDVKQEDLDDSTAKALPLFNGPQMRRSQ